MTIKTVCALTLKQDAIFGSYVDYEVYPLASVFKDSDDEAITSYLRTTNLYINIQECIVLEITLSHGETLRFYRAKGRDVVSKCDVVRDYLVVDSLFIEN